MVNENKELRQYNTQACDGVFMLNVSQELGKKQTSLFLKDKQR